MKEAQTVLDELLKEQKLDQEAYDKLFALYSAQVEAKRLADLEAKRKELESLGYKPVPVVDDKGNVVDYKAEKVTIKHIKLLHRLQLQKQNLRNNFQTLE